MFLNDNNLQVNFNDSINTEMLIVGRKTMYVKVANTDVIKTEIDRQM
jgi:hypothetical protein